MANEIGQEITNEPIDRSKGPFRQFFSDPKNVATALLFGAALAQPRRPDSNGLQTLLQRAAGAAAFRGALEGGVQKQKLQREQTAFERAKAERELGLQGRQVAATEQGNVLRQQQLEQSQSQFETQLGSSEEQAALNRALELQLAQIKEAPTEQDLIGIAMQNVPYLLDTMQFDDNLSPTEKMQLAQNEAIKGVLMFRSLLSAGAKIVRGDDGKMYVDTGDGTRLTVPQATTPPPTSAPPVTPPALSAAQQAAQLDAQQQNSPFVRTPGERAQRANVGSRALIDEARQSSQQAAIFNTAQRFRRAAQLGAQFRRDDVALLAQADDNTLISIGLTADEIAKIRQLAEQL